MNTIFNILIVLILIIGLMRLLHCLYAKKYNSYIYPPCPLNTNGIKNTIIIMLCLIIIVLQFKILYS